MTVRRWIEYSAAILAGNALYFLVLLPGLGGPVEHHPLRLDAGLAIDFACCVLVYGAIRLGAAHARRWNERTADRKRLERERMTSDE